MRRWLRWLRWTLLVVAVLAVLAFGLAWWAMRQSLPQIDGDGERARSRRRGHHRTRRARHSGDHRRLAHRPRLRHRLRARAGPLLPDGPVAPAGGGRAVGAVRRGGAETGPAHAPLRLPRRRAARDRSRARERARDHRGLCARRERRPRKPAPPGRGNTCCCARVRAPGCRRTRCWWCTRCGGSCSTARCATRSTGAGSSAPRPTAATPAAAHELITFVYAGHSDWDTPNYSADRRCVQCGLHRLRAACSRIPFRRSCVSPARRTNRRKRPSRPAATTGRWPACTRARAWR